MPSIPPQESDEEEVKEIRQLLYLLYQNDEINKTLYNNLIKLL